jgi:hypothetical protein
VTIDEPNITLTDCLNIVRKLRKQEHAWAFNEPVDTVALGIPDYYTVIKRPMDLGTIEKNLVGGKHYSTSACALF